MQTKDVVSLPLAPLSTCRTLECKFGIHLEKSDHIYGSLMFVVESIWNTDYSSVRLISTLSVYLLNLVGAEGVEPPTYWV